MRTNVVSNDSNPDPITGAPGSHPIGTGVGAALGGAAAGAAAGTVAGPVGTVVGAAVGAIAGGLAGKGVAEAIDPSAEDAYWRDNYKNRTYAGPASRYEDFGPAFGYGVSAFSLYPERSFDEVESDLARDWEKSRGTSSLKWDQAKHATRDAWSRLSESAERVIP